MTAQPIPDPVVTESSVTVRTRIGRPAVLAPAEPVATATPAAPAAPAAPATATPAAPAAPAAPARATPAAPAAATPAAPAAATPTALATATPTAPATATPTALAAATPTALATATPTALAAAALVRAAPAGLAVSAPDAPLGPPHAPGGTVYNAIIEPSSQRRRSRWLRLLPRLVVGTHVASGSALRRLSPPATASGLVLGFDAARQVASVRLFQPEPTRIALVGGLWAARILVFRALALGAQVTVATGRPDAWAGLGRWAAGWDDRVLVQALDQPFTATSTPFSPALVVHDGGTFGRKLGPWQAALSVVPHLTAYAFQTIREASLVAVQRLTPDEVAAGTPVLGLNREAVALVSALQDEMLALYDSGDPRYIWTQPTRIEREQFGQPRRFDPRSDIRSLSAASAAPR